MGIARTQTSPYAARQQAAVGAAKGKSARTRTSPQVSNLGHLCKGEEEGKASRPGSAARAGSLPSNVFGSAEQISSASASLGDRPPSQRQHVTFAPMDVTGSASPPEVSYGHAAYRMGAASSASPSSRASPTDPGSGGRYVSGSGTEAPRPSFKRLPLQTLGPASYVSEKTFLVEGYGGSPFPSWCIFV